MHHMILKGHILLVNATLSTYWINVAEQHADAEYIGPIFQIEVDPRVIDHFEWNGVD